MKLENHAYAWLYICFQFTIAGAMYNYGCVHSLYAIVDYLMN